MCNIRCSKQLKIKSISTLFSNLFTSLQVYNQFKPANVRRFYRSFTQKPNTKLISSQLLQNPKMAAINGSNCRFLTKNLLLLFEEAAFLQLFKFIACIYNANVIFQSVPQGYYVQERINGRVATTAGGIIKISRLNFQRVLNQYIHDLLYTENCPLSSAKS